MPTNPNTDPQQQAFEGIIARREGRKNVVYRDTRGILTGGLGHKILPTDNLSFGDPIAEATIDAWFLKDGAVSMAAARKQVKQAGITSLDFIPWLASVNYQLGPDWTQKFPHTWDMIVEGAYLSAALALGNTAWDMQTPVRVQDFQKALRALPPKPHITS
jgi:GH24 family phage-related lysozyme (muramidase)